MMLQRIDAIIDREPNHWPLIYLWMICDNKTVAFTIIHPRNIVYSLVDDEKGSDCGQLVTIYLKVSLLSS